MLAYFPGGIWSTKRTIVRISRQGNVEPLDIEPGAYLSVAMSPDGTRMAIAEFENGKTNLSIHDLARGVGTLVPLDVVNNWPVWSPDGSEIVFTTARNGPWDIYRFAVDGRSGPESLVEGSPDQESMAWSPDGRFVLWLENDEVRAMDLVGDRAPRVLVSDGDPEGLSISPDSRWLAYHAWVSGQREVLVRRFPDGVRGYRVSIDGGEYPLWSRDGRELLYRRGDAVLAASLRIVGDEISAERPRELFRGDYVSSSNHTWSYDPTTDESIMIRRGEHEISRDRFVVVIDWPSELAGRTQR